MHIGPVHIEETGSSIRLSVLASPATTGIEPFRLWFQAPRACEGMLDPSANAFVAALFLTAMKLGEELTSDSPVSETLQGNLRLLTRRIAAWPRTDSWRMRVKDTPIHAPLQGGGHPDPSGRLGCFFSLGVDSFFSLHAVPRISHLVFVDGYDIPLDNVRLLAETHRRLEDVAGRTEKQCVILASNLRQVVDRFVGWEMNHGAALAGAGLVLGMGLPEILISSSDSYITRAPYGTHPDIDPLWSTERTTFVPFGTGHKRHEKLRALAGDSLFREHVRVCWKNVENRYNCRSCVKCLRTMLQLKVIGELEHVPTLAGPLPLQALDRITEPRHRWFLWEDLLQDLTQAPEDRAIAARITAMLRRSKSKHFRRSLRRWPTHPFA